MAYDQRCPRFEKAAELLGKKWTGLILRSLMGGSRRFGEIRVNVPELSDRVLSERLRELEDEGIVSRVVHTTKPVLIEYGLTEMGRDLSGVVDAIQGWAERWVPVEGQE